MKYRTLTFAFAACLLSSFALADNPSDAPLMSNDAYAAANQQQDTADHARRQSKQKCDPATAKSNPEASSKDNRRAEQSTPDHPTVATK
jgi:hypothetical protein